MNLHWLCAALLAAGVLLGCVPHKPPAANAPFCPDRNNYIAMDSMPHCRLALGQRFVVSMPHSRGSHAALRTICLGPWKGEEFVINFGGLDYCVLPARR